MPSVELKVCGRQVESEKLYDSFNAHGCAFTQRFVLTKFLLANGDRLVNGNTREEASDIIADEYFIVCQFDVCHPLHEILGVSQDVFGCFNERSQYVG